MLPVADIFCPGWKTHRTGSSLNGCVCFIQTQEDDHHVPTQHNEGITRLTNRESGNSQNCFINSRIIFTLQWGKTGPCILHDGIFVWIRIKPNDLLINCWIVRVLCFLPPFLLLMISSTIFAMIAILRSPLASALWASDPRIWIKPRGRGWGHQSVILPAPWWSSWGHLPVLQSSAAFCRPGPDISPNLWPTNFCRMWWIRCQMALL